MSEVSDSDVYVCVTLGNLRYTYGIISRDTVLPPCHFVDGSSMGFIEEAEGIAIYKH